MLSLRVIHRYTTFVFNLNMFDVMLWSKNMKPYDFSEDLQITGEFDNRPGTRRF